MLASTPPGQKMDEAAHTCIPLQSYSKAISWRKGQEAAFSLHISVQIKEERWKEGLEINIYINLYVSCQMTFNNLLLKLWPSHHTKKQFHHLGTH